MLELYLDSADIEQIKRLQTCLPIKGVTTNPTILARANIGVNALLSSLSSIVPVDCRFHVQVTCRTVETMVDEAEQLNALPYDIVVKVPATEIGLAAIKLMKARNYTVLATAIYSAHQGFLAALCGADYLAPYVNRIDASGGDGVSVAADLQNLTERYQLSCKVLPASFKSVQQVMAVLRLGVGAITIPGDIAVQMLENPWVDNAVEQFCQDWQGVFEDKPAFKS